MTMSVIPEHSPVRSRFAPEPVETTRRSNRDGGQQTTNKFVIKPVETSRCSNRNNDEIKSKFSPVPIETSRRSKRNNDEAIKSKFSPFPIETSTRTNRIEGIKSRFTIEPIETSQRNNYTVETAKSRFTPRLVETNRNDRMTSESTKPRFLPEPVETTRRSNMEPAPTPLTTQALHTFLTTLPQPISTIRFSNRAGPQRFSDRDSEGCPSLSSSPLSTTSSASCSNLSLATVPTDFLPSRDLSAFQNNANNVNGDAKSELTPRSDTKEVSFQHEAPAIRRNTREFPERDSSFDHAVQSHEIDQRKQHTQEFQEQQRQESTKKLHQYQQEPNQRPVQKKVEFSPLPLSNAPKNKKKPLVPFSFIGPRFKPVMMLDIKNQVLNSPLPTTRYYESNKPSSSPVDYFSSNPAEPSTPTPSSPISRSTSAASSNETNITVPPLTASKAEEVEVFTEPEAEDDTILCPTCKAEVTTEFVQMVYTYASLNHEAIGKKFDEELALGTKWSLQRVKADRFEALREYVGYYVDTKPHVVAGQGCW